MKTNTGGYRIVLNADQALMNECCGIFSASVPSCLRGSMLDWLYFPFSAPPLAGNTTVADLRNGVGQLGGWNPIMRVITSFILT
jgi:hypothetical protein